jgi:hypothetical protein
MSEPWSCPACLLGRCDLCTGRLQVQRVRGTVRDVPCGHEHPARGPIARVLAAIGPTTTRET